MNYEPNAQQVTLENAANATTINCGQRKCDCVIWYFSSTLVRIKGSVNELCTKRTAGNLFNCKNMYHRIPVKTNSFSNNVPVNIVASSGLCNFVPLYQYPRPPIPSSSDGMVCVGRPPPPPSSQNNKRKQTFFLLFNFFFSINNE